MAMTQTLLPATLRLRPAAVQPLSHADACSSLSDFLSSDSSTLLAGSGAVRASLFRLVQGLQEDIAAAPLMAKEELIKDEAGDKKDKKRRKSTADGEGKKIKKRKVEA
ncbi:hypothetical protein JCM8547_009381 [Rhodosporidiobolus lusitaniae]